VSKKALIAIGGNSLIRSGERGTLQEQSKNAEATAKSIVQMINLGWDVIITHGNGPQAGAALLRSERAANEVYTHSLDMCVATTQSEIGYILQKELEYQLLKNKINKKVVVIPTMVLVDTKDPAFQNPTKPIGPFYEKHIAEIKSKTLGWKIVEDSNRGYRRVVPSPEPLKVLQLDVIKSIINMGIITIALGGGGIPVIINKDGKIIGTEAVIDKDRSSALLASDLKVDLFIISTDADQVYINFKQPNEQGIRKADLKTIKKYYNEGHFPPGSMGPKIESAIKFIENGGNKVIITSYEYLTEALQEKAGTHIVKKIV